MKRPAPITPVSGIGTVTLWEVDAVCAIPVQSPSVRIHAWHSSSVESPCWRKISSKGRVNRDRLCKCQVRWKHSILWTDRRGQFGQRRCVDREFDGDFGVLGQGARGDQKTEPVKPRLVALKFTTIWANRCGQLSKLGGRAGTVIPWHAR